MEDRPRTIVLVVADDLGWGDPGCFNPDSAVPTPALNRVASEGMRFTHWRTPSALCTPSRYALLTGSSHWRTGQARPLVSPYGPPIVGVTEPTLPRALARTGYKTALVGKWHLGLHYPAYGGGTASSESDLDVTGRLTRGPLAAGFDRFFGTAGCCTSDPPYAFVQDDRFLTEPVLPSPAWLNALPGVVPGKMAEGWDVTTVDDTLIDAAAAVLADHAASNGPPLFLMVALSAPHNPWVPPAEMVGASGDGARGDMAATFDRSVGRLLSTIDGLELAPETLLIVTSDHGPQYEEGPRGHRPTGPLRGRKNTVWEGGVRVPTVIRWPGRVRPGTVSSAELQHVDLLPTLAALAGVPEEGLAATDGQSQVEALLGSGPTKPRGAALLESGGSSHRIGSWAVLENGWKLHVPIGDDGRELGARLYHLPGDPGEKHDVGARYPGVASALGRTLETALAAAGWASLSDPAPLPAP